ncbi:MAG TPA: methyltransferase domain-containing protein [Candidatus Sulfotelmatobacter sp.]|nr:methyltransferase domain-containing protein [Candidatus Sulfotelmatobacter sp.]
MNGLLKKIRRKIRIPAPLYPLANASKARFECPLCGYCGPFRDMDGFAGKRLHVECPRCGAMERHRLQYLVVKDIVDTLKESKCRMLHFAPEPFFRRIFTQRFGTYETADLEMKGVDHQVDLQNLPFRDATYDLIFASHVLEHVPDDRKAIGEIRRILRPGGLAILPVPVVCETTVEYAEANPHEAYHVRAPGVDYFNKYRPFFSRVEVRTSAELPEKYQLYVYEDRSVWPTAECPLRPPMQGERHADFVPICYV